MILALDIGNTSTVAGLVECGTNSVLFHKRFDTDPGRTALSSTRALLGEFSQSSNSFDRGGVEACSVDGAIICSVVPDAVPGLVAALDAFIGKPVSVVSMDEVGESRARAASFRIPGRLLQV